MVRSQCHSPRTKSGRTPSTAPAATIRRDEGERRDAAPSARTRAAPARRRDRRTRSALARRARSRLTSPTTTRSWRRRSLCEGSSRRARSATARNAAADTARTTALAGGHRLGAGATRASPTSCSAGITTLIVQIPGVTRGGARAMHTFGGQTSIGPAQALARIRPELARIGRSARQLARLDSSAMKAAEIREQFLSFFEERGHLRLPSASLVPSVHDPSVLLTTAGMQPLKPYFRGEEEPPARRLTTCQKSFRTVDIEVVGHDQAPPHVLRDARQLLGRRLLQAGRRRVRVGAVHAGLRARPREHLDHRLRRRRRARPRPRRGGDRVSGARSASPTSGSSCSAPRTTSGSPARPAPAAPARSSTSTAGRTSAATRTGPATTRSASSSSGTSCSCSTSCTRTAR